MEMNLIAPLIVVCVLVLGGILGVLLVWLLSE